MDYIETTPKQRLHWKRRQQSYAWISLIALSAFAFSVIWSYGQKTVEALESPDLKLCGLDVILCPFESYASVMPNLRLTDTVYEVLSTAYSSRVGETDSTPCIAADGTDICERYQNGEGICAANWLPLGTKIYVEGYGDCTVADRMAKKNSEKLDVYFGYDTYSAYEWGRRFTKVYKLNS